jgi:hypothetical protein
MHIHVCHSNNNRINNASKEIQNLIDKNAARKCDKEVETTTRQT